MARCSLGNHGKCAACDSNVDATHPHQHHVWINRPNEVLCQDCCACIVKSARLVLEALHEIYGDIGSMNYERLIDQDTVRVMVQIPFDFRASTN